MTINDAKLMTAKPNDAKLMTAKLNDAKLMTSPLNLLTLRLSDFQTFRLSDFRPAEGVNLNLNLPKA